MPAGTILLAALSLALASLSPATAQDGDVVLDHRKIRSGTDGLNNRTSFLSHFGDATAILGDLNGDGITELAVGAAMDSDGGFGAGAVWVLFLNSDGTVRGEQKISSLYGGFGGSLLWGDGFGCGLAALGDLDGDGTVELAVGARSDNGGGPARGAMWILFLHANGTVKGEQKINAVSGGFTGVLDDGDYFGSSLATLGDLDLDGTVDLAVGALKDDDGGENRGAVWILFLNSDGTVRMQQKISDTEGGFSGILTDMDWFGVSVELLGDLEGDGVVELAVGASGDDTGTTAEAGAVWILSLLPDGTVAAVRKISDAVGGLGIGLRDGDLFGASIALPGDLDGDGAVDALVGLPGRDGTGTDRGAVWALLLEDGGAVHETRRFEDVWAGFAGPLHDGDAFGAAVCAGVDLDDDGRDEFVVGAPGLVFVFGYVGMLPGLSTPFGELLIDVMAEWVFNDWKNLAGGTTTHHAVSIPNDLALMGFEVSTQALLNNVGGQAQLANAWDLVVGF